MTADGHVVLDVNLSLDRFVAGPGSRPGQPLGAGGDRLEGRE
jgi:hypothetical protein